MAGIGGMGGGYFYDAASGWRKAMPSDEDYKAMAAARSGPRLLRGAERDFAQTKREVQFRAQRERLVEAVKRLLAKEPDAEAFARDALREAGHNVL